MTYTFGLRWFTVRVTFHPVLSAVVFVVVKLGWHWQLVRHIWWAYTGVYIL